MPKLSALFNRAKTLKEGSSGKTRSASEKPSYAGGSIPALNFAGSNTVGTHKKAGSNSLVNKFTPLSAGGKAYGLSAYEMHKPAAPKAVKLDDFHIVKRVGKGGFASVYLVRLKASTGRYWALKVIKKSEVVKLKQEKQILNEKNILRSITHPFIVEMAQTFQDQQYLYMVLEYLHGGDLFCYLRKSQKFEEDEAKFYVSEVLIALAYLHSVDVVYRDLKPEVYLFILKHKNILLDSTGHIKLADFGFAKVVTKTTGSFCGTPDYIAAEIVAGKPYNQSVDWWSLGVLIFELNSGKTPFGDDSSEKIYDNIQAGNIKWSSTIRGSCKDVIAALLKIDPRERLGSGPGGAKDIKSSAWFSTINWTKLEARQFTPPHVPVFEAPHILENQKPSTRRDEVLESLKPGAAAWMNGDAFFEAFKDF
jgi:serine/threonine protein kinase